MVSPALPTNTLRAAAQLAQWDCAVPNHTIETTHYSVRYFINTSMAVNTMDGSQHQALGVSFSGEITE
jgi:hypothetical protein